MWLPVSVDWHPRRSHFGRKEMMEWRSVANFFSENSLHRSNCQSRINQGNHVKIVESRKSNLAPAALPVFFFSS
jgi:hypothetical protein